MNTPTNSEALPLTAGAALRGLKWQAVINGRKCINGARYSATITGEIEASEDWSTIYDVMHNLAVQVVRSVRPVPPSCVQMTLVDTEYAEADPRHD